ncbi:MAG TPA: hypothetical protein VJ441_01100, partial [Dehalococcoidia bacterium]|nr:hypothetical protein [Dehalococcoidia bacterium]
MNKNIAVIGCGYWGKNLVRNFAELGALHTLCDTDRKKLEHFQALYPGLATEVSFPEVLRNGE